MASAEDHLLEIVRSNEAKIERLERQVDRLLLLLQEDYAQGNAEDDGCGGRYGHSGARDLIVLKVECDV